MLPTPPQKTLIFLAPLLLGNEEQWGLIFLTRLFWCGCHWRSHNKLDHLKEENLYCAALNISLSAPRLSYTISGYNNTLNSPTKRKTQRKLSAALSNTKMSNPIPWTLNSVLTHVQSVGEPLRLFGSFTAPVDPEGRRRSFADWFKLGRQQVLQRVGCGSPTEGAHILQPSERKCLSLGKGRGKETTVRWMINIQNTTDSAKGGTASSSCSVRPSSLSFSTHMDQFVCTFTSHTHWRAWARKAKTVWVKFNMPTGCSFS